MRFCPSCGAELPSTLMICPRCGTTLSAPTSEQESVADLSSTPTVFGPLRESVSLPEVSLTEAASNPILEEQLKGGTNYGMQTVQVSSPYAIGTDVSHPLTPAPMQMGNFYPMVSQPMPMFTPFTSEPQAPRPSSISRPMLLLLGAVALLLILGGASLIFYSAIIHPAQLAQLRVETTATVQMALTQDAHVTATAQAQANATATAQTQATATALQAIYTQATSGSPALVSSLAYQDGNNWDAYDTTDGGGCHFVNGTLRASVYTKTYYIPCLALNSNYSNFAFQARMTIVQGDAGGLLFRASSDNVNEYLFRVWSNGDYDLSVAKNNRSQFLVQDHSAVIKTGSGQTNTLTIIMRSNTIYFYVNQQYLGSASDSTLSAGAVGVFAADQTGNTDVDFTNAKAWAL